MKVHVVTLLAVLAFAGSAVARQGDTVSLKIGQQRTVKPSKVRIKFISVVEDSRCPTDVNCIWAGNAKIKVLVSISRTSREFEINTNLGPQGDQLDGWAINLVELTPSPTSKGGTSKGSYRAKFTVTRLTR
ncbi:MAG: hypothetical protein H0X08_08475 [Blastocatellia bacterium]|nr:hypothetical protein [Blastocatellia bacterium]